MYLFATSITWQQFESPCSLLFCLTQRMNTSNLWTYNLLYFPLQKNFYHDLNITAIIHHVLWLWPLSSTQISPISVLHRNPFLSTITDRLVSNGCAWHTLTIRPEYRDIISVSVMQFLLCHTILHTLLWNRDKHHLNSSRTSFPCEDCYVHVPGISRLEMYFTARSNCSVSIRFRNMNQLRFLWNTR